MLKKNEKGLRYNKNKLKWSLVHFKSLEPMVQVLQFGAKKYKPWNWSKGLYWSEIIDSIIRHLTAFKEGEDIDKESKLPHIGHLLANLMFLSYMYQFRKDLDDRFKNK
jgi:hypothetical protein